MRCVSITIQWLKCTTFISRHGRGLAHTHCPYHASYILLASCWLSARESVANRGRAGALWGIALSSTYATCPYSPQYLQCMALYIGVCLSCNAANGSVLRAIVGIMRALVLGVNATITTEGNMDFQRMKFQWHVKPVGNKACPLCGCNNVRSGVRHRQREGEVVQYEKIIKVCFGTDTSIEVIKPKK